MSQSTWVLDPTHSKIGFKIRHILITTVFGEFTAKEARIEGEADSLETATLHFECEANSIHTNNDERDKDLRGANFFEVKRYPSLTFVSTKITKKKPGAYTLKGDLTVKGITQNITLNAAYNVTPAEDGSALKAQLTLSGTINRKDFGINWDISKESGGVLIGEEVTLLGEMVFVKQE